MFEGEISDSICELNPLFKFIMTLQIKEKLTYNGRVYYLFDEPLRPYLYKHPIERPSCTRTFSTACWRGYVGHWVIEDSKLYLVELYSIDKEPLLDKLFPGQEKVFAEWFSDTIHTISDKMYKYYEFKIEKGRLVKVGKKENEYIRDLDFDELLESL